MSPGRIHWAKTELRNRYFAASFSSDIMMFGTKSPGHSSGSFLEVSKRFDALRADNRLSTHIFLCFAQTSFPSCSFVISRGAGRNIEKTAQLFSGFVLLFTLIDPWWFDGLLTAPDQ
jgi:hypothetical protein